MLLEHSLVNTELGPSGAQERVFSMKVAGKAMLVKRGFTLWAVVHVSELLNCFSCAHRVPLSVDPRLPHLLTVDCVCRCLTVLVTLSRGVPSGLSPSPTTFSPKPWFPS